MEHSRHGHELHEPLQVRSPTDGSHSEGPSASSSLANRPFSGYLTRVPVPLQSWVTSQISPFASRLVGQVLSCPASDTPTHVRFILNDGVVPLTGIKGCAKNKDGLCALDKFVSGLKARVAEIDYQFDCFANYTVPAPDTIVDGRYPPALRNGTA